MNEAEARRRFAETRVGRLATVSADGAPHVVPLVFAVDGDVVYSAVDHKPKASRRLRRLANIRAEPRVSVLVDHYSEDWANLWWVRADGRARVVEGGPELDRALELLVTKHPQYRDKPPEGPAIVMIVDRWVAWP